MREKYKRRRIIFIMLAVAGICALILTNPAAWQKVYFSDITDTINEQFSKLFKTKEDEPIAIPTSPESSDGPLAVDVLSKLEIKGRAPKTNYSRDQFYDAWPKENGCNLRQRILKRDFGDTAVLDKDNCTVISGKIYEPYTGQEMEFSEKSQISKGLQIDHVVALSDAWQKGAQYKTADERFKIATDPLNLIAVDSSANQKKSDGDAATWLPKNKGFRCQYVARQISVKYKYNLWITNAEKDAMNSVLSACPNERAIGVTLN